MPATAGRNGYWPATPPVPGMAATPCGRGPVRRADLAKYTRGVSSRSTSGRRRAWVPTTRAAWRHLAAAMTRGAGQVSLLEHIRGPRDLKDLSEEELPQLAAEIRDNLIQIVSRNGGHLGPNLGVVELTIALHRVFDSPVDRILFDTGHQSYVHKLLTGRYPAVRHAAAARRADRLPEPGRVRARRDRKLPRFHEPVLRRRSGQGLPAARREATAAWSPSSGTAPSPAAWPGRR